MGWVVETNCEPVFVDHASGRKLSAAICLQFEVRVERRHAVETVAQENKKNSLAIHCFQ